MKLINKRANKIKANCEKGFTLIELLIYMGLLAIMLVTITEMFVAMLDIKVAAEALSSVEQDTQYIFTRLNYDIHRAESILTPTSPGETTNTLVLSIGGENYTYSLNSQNLQLTNNSGSHIINGNRSAITSATFQKIGPPTGNQTVKINIVVESVSQTRSGTEQKIIGTAVGTR